MELLAVVYKNKEAEAERNARETPITEKNAS